ncbi:MAG: hypothetical protein HY918_00200 [Candidatus Doudnabacteria bacterium]|nr:hypothetical protein [Candidatus Doudnabacteria bacterium]
MLETKEQKQYFAAAIVLIVILSLISFISKPNLKITDTANQQKSNSYLDSQAYLNYLNTLKIDKQASQDLFQTIITKDEIKQEVVKALGADKPVVAPTIDSKKIKTSSASNTTSVSQYLTDSLSEAYSFNNNSLSQSTEVFGADSSAVNDLKPKVDQLESKLYAMTVPKDAVTLHKSLITAYAAYDDLLAAAQKYQPDDYSKNDALWPEVYKSYVVANSAANTYNDELGKLADKYKIAYVTVNDYYADAGSNQAAHNIFIPEAKAFLGLSWSFTIGDIPRIIMDSVKEGLRSAYLQFMGSMLNKLVTKIEQNYIITNFLYYSDALVNGQYTDDYLNKYVNDALDRQIIKKFIPQFSCGQQNENLKPVFQAKASEYLGFDPSSVSLSDPDYYAKMARVGQYMSSPEGWQQYYQSLAQTTESEAQKAAEKELSSSGLKTPRDIQGSTISNSINSIVSAERASFVALLQLGVDNADSIISSTVAQLTQTLVNRFVFQGVTGNGGSIAVLKEQSTCVAAAVVNPVVALPLSQYQNTSVTATAQAATAYACSSVNSTNTDCSSAVLGELGICANSPSQHTGQQTCSDLKKSPYVSAMLSQCNLQPRPTAECSSLQNYLSKIP